MFLSGGVVSFGGSAGVYSGNTASVAASPTSGNYLAAEPGGAVTFSFRAPLTQFQLLWGSVDSYNSLTFVGSNGSTQLVTGSDIQAADGSSASAYVTISGLNAFTKVIASSSSPAFEFLPDVQVPEPGTLALVGLGLGGLAWMRRRRT